MDSEKNTETLERGFLESKLSENEGFCSKILVDENPGCLSNVSEKCVVDGCSDRNECSSVEFERINFNESVEESMELKFCGDEGDKTANVEECVGEFDDNLDLDELFQEEKIEEIMEGDNDVLHPHERGSPTKIEVSGNNINLFVEVFGPLDGISGSDDNLVNSTKCKLGDGDFKQELALEENGTLSSGVTDLSANYEGKDSTGEQECTFDVGDLVWIKTRTQLWWPGIISDPSSAPEDMAKCETKGSYLVKYYDSANFACCENADLKPFLEYYEQMSLQKSSRNFYGSVEKALCEIGQRVNLTMTCPCLLKKSQNNEENLVPTQKARKFDVMLLSQFQPATFVADIRDLARSTCVRSKVELMVIKNRLAPFYRAVGHSELPMQMLRLGSDAAQTTHEGEKQNAYVEAQDGSMTRSRRKRKNQSDASDIFFDDKTTSSPKGLESRERKKSKYLSYPYVDVKKGEEKEDPKQSSTPEVTNSSSDSRKRGSTKKPPKGHHVISKADDISVCSDELLAELRSSARDCSYISRSKYSDSLKRFFSSFRIFAFLDADIASKIHVDQQALNLDKAEVQMEGSKVVRKPRKKKTSVVESAGNAVGDETSVAENKKAKEKAKGRRGRKKKEVKIPEEQLEEVSVVIESENQQVPLASGSLENAIKEREKIVPDLESVQNSLSMETITYPRGSCMISFQQPFSAPFKSSTAPHPSGASTPGLADINSIPKLPDLNGNHVDHIPVGGPPSIDVVNPISEQRKEGLASPIINGVHQIGFAYVSPFKNVPITFQDTPLSNNGATGPHQCLLNGEFPAAQTLNPITKNAGVSPLVQQHSLLMGSFLSDVKPTPKKRKRKEKTSEVASAIPDLNNNFMDMMSPPGMPTPEGISIPPESESQKKMRCRSATTEPRGSLLLNFTPGCIPCKETLVTTFSRFGLLKESELQVLTDESVKVVYERSSDARFAFRSLEKSHTFGESLISFNLDSCSIPNPPKIRKRKNVQLQLQSFMPASACKNRTKAGERPDIAFIKQNVAMMKATLEKAGDNLSQETRAKLENEIKAFLDKISSVTGSSS